MSDIHEMDEDYATPPGEELFQAEDVALPTVPVEVQGVTPVIPAGGRTTGFWFFEVTATVPQKILGDDPRRTSATILPVDNDIRIASSQSGCLSNAVPLIPAGVPVVLNTSDEIWAAGDLTTAQITVLTESWAR